jgi:hypothetical protein
VSSKRDLSPRVDESGHIRLYVEVGGPSWRTFTSATPPEAAAWLRELADDVERAKAEVPQ